jgi:hypothetical protein
MLDAGGNPVPCRCGGSHQRSRPRWFGTGIAWRGLTPSRRAWPMKFDELRSVGHNIADSLASGSGLLIGGPITNVYSEARRSPEGFITVDFLTGRTSGGRPSPSLARAIELYRDALLDLCGRHGTSPSKFRELTARYSVEKRAKRFIVTTADHQGRRQVDEYVGIPGKHIRTIERLGRVRSSKMGFARAKSIKRA